MIYKVGVMGATGRMGREILSLLEPGFIIGEDRLEFGEKGPVHVWIDFSRPQGTLELLKTISEPIVIGTTGFTAEEFQQIKLFSEKHPVLVTANTSTGMNLMMRMLEQSSVAASLNYDVLASETHHKHKTDSPSGTLKALLEILKQQGHSNIQVQAARVGNEKGTHTISFFSEDEELTLTHRVTSRRVFARGALLAARYIASKKDPGLYTFQDIETIPQ